MAVLDSFLASNAIWSMVVVIVLQAVYVLLMAWLFQRTLAHLQREHSDNVELSIRLERAELVRDAYQLENAELRAELDRAKRLRAWNVKMMRPPPRIVGVIDEN